MDATPLVIAHMDAPSRPWATGRVCEFPKQRSRKDGLGTMCTGHWRAYVKGLREAWVGMTTPDQDTFGGGEEADAAYRHRSPVIRPRPRVRGPRLDWTCLRTLSGRVEHRTDAAPGSARTHVEGEFWA